MAARTVAALVDYIASLEYPELAGMDLETCEIYWSRSKSPADWASLDTDWVFKHALKGVRKNSELRAKVEMNEEGKHPAPSLLCPAKKKPKTPPAAVKLPKRESPEVIASRKSGHPAVPAFAGCVSPTSQELGPDVDGILGILAKFARARIPKVSEGLVRSHCILRGNMEDDDFDRAFRIAKRQQLITVKPGIVSLSPTSHAMRAVDAQPPPTNEAAIRAIQELVDNPFVRLFIFCISDGHVWSVDRCIGGAVEGFDPRVLLNEVNSELGIFKFLADGCVRLNDFVLPEGPAEPAL